MTAHGREEERYWCSCGHILPSERLDAATEVRELDDGATVRLCREHGAPVGMQAAAGSDGETRL